MEELRRPTQTWCDETGEVSRHRKGLSGGAPRPVSRPVSGGLVPGRSWRVDQLNPNELLANVALELTEHKKGEYQFVDPHDLDKSQYVNKGRTLIEEVSHETESKIAVMFAGLFCSRL
jgi:hypothetical protein